MQVEKSYFYLLVNNLFKTQKYEKKRAPHFFLILY